VAFYAFFVNVHPFGDFAALAYGDIAGALAALAAGVVGCLAAVKSSGRTRLAWTLLAVGCLAWGTGESAWTFYEVALRQATPFPSAADVGYLAMVPLVFFGLVLVSSAHRSLARIRTALDALAFVLAGSAIAWHYVLYPIYQDSQTALLEKALGGAYPLGDMLLFFTLAIAMYRHRGGHGGAVLSTFAIGLALFLAADISFAYLTLHDAYASGSVIDYGWLTGFLVMGLAGALQVERQADFSFDEEARVVSAWRQSIPLGLVLLVVAVIVAAGRNAALARDIPLLVMVSLVVPTVVVRQLLVLSENVRLNRELERSYAELREQSRRDPLTGVLNHGAIIDDIRDTLERSASGVQHGLAVVDGDGLKETNDRYGHQLGDVLLTTAAAILQRRDAVVGRSGGDEFIVLLPDSGSSAAECYREEVAKAMADASLRNEVTGANIPMSASIGIAVFPDDGETFEALAQHADRVMYGRKRGGASRAVA
jgi:diguanylate cyclase (GGDEF)-like protein